MIELVFHCDVCGVTKQPSNGWTMASISQEASEYTPPSISMYPWFELWQENKDLKHLCGSDCESKFVSKITASWRENPPTRRIRGEKAYATLAARQGGLVGITVDVSNEQSWSAPALENNLESATSSSIPSPPMVSQTFIAYPVGRAIDTNSGLDQPNNDRNE